MSDTIKQIPLFKPVFQKEAVLKEIEECLDKGWTGLGYKTVEFEKKWSEYTMLPYSHFLNSASSGLHLACELARLRRGRGKIVTTPLTFVATNHAILHAGLEPVFIDVDDTLTMDPALLSEYLGEHSVSITAVMFVAMGGNSGNLNDIARVCKHYNIPLILDAAHASGTLMVKGNDGSDTSLIHIGQEADYTIFSFQAVKNLPTGDSGMLCCKHSHEDTLARKLSWLGIDKDTWKRTEEGGNWKYDVNYLGWKYHGNSIMAAMGIVGLSYLDSGNYIRGLQATLYDHELDKNYKRIAVSPDCMSSHHLYQVRAEASYSTKRDNIIAFAKEKAGVQLGVHYDDNREHEVYARFRDSFTCKNSRQISRELISLPIGPHLREKDVNTVIEVMNDAWSMA